MLKRIGKWLRKGRPSLRDRVTGCESRLEGAAQHCQRLQERIGRVCRHETLRLSVDVDSSGRVSVLCARCDDCEGRWRFSDAEEWGGQIGCLSMRPNWHKVPNLIRAKAKKLGLTIPAGKKEKE